VCSFTLTTRRCGWKEGCMLRQGRREEKNSRITGDTENCNANESIWRRMSYERNRRSWGDRQVGSNPPLHFSEYIWRHLFSNGQDISQYFAQYHSGPDVASKRSVSWDSTHIYESDITHVMVIVNRLRLKSFVTGIAILKCVWVCHLCISLTNLIEYDCTAEYFQLRKSLSLN
jgi:hypothetical protein